MSIWLENFIDPAYAPAASALLLLLLVVVLILIVLRIYRGLTSGTFIAGGRGRKARLAVMDAAAVDAKRRLVLVRRDDVEHLILIGGPTDVVVERDIRLVASAARPRAAEPAPETVLEASGRQVETPRIPAARPARVEPRPVARPPSPPAEPAPLGPAARTEPIMRQPLPLQAQSHRPAAPPAASVPAREATAPAAPRPLPSMATPGAASVPANDVDADLDAALLKELEGNLDPQPTRQVRERELSLEAEMEKLLNDLSTGRER